VSSNEMEMPRKSGRTPKDLSRERAVRRTDIGGARVGGFDRIAKWGISPKARSDVELPGGGQTLRSWVMLFRMLRFCRMCLVTRQTATREVCEGCASELLPLLDENGAISRDFLVARGTCCSNGCQNCPYEKVTSSGGQCAGNSRAKSCQRCGADFECWSGGCWCNNLRLSSATLKWLERSYDDCLCPLCLAEFSTP
jgi:hypothetical protein